MKCRKKVEPEGLVYFKTNSKNKMHIHKGKCPECGTTVCVLSKEKLN